MITLDLLALLPYLVLAGTVVVVLLAIAFHRDHTLALALSLLGLAAAFGSLWAVPSASTRRLTTLLVVDDYALFFLGLVLAASIAVALLAHGYLRARVDRPEEFYLLLLLATLGSSVLVAANHFASFFLGLEILSVSLYALIAYPRGYAPGVEAGFKYLVLAGTSSAFLLFGMALVYAVLGTMEFGSMASALAVGGAARGALMVVGLALLIVGVGFKLAVVPFHLWTPDVYEGAPAPVTAFVATVSKGAVFALLLRYFTQVDVRAYGSLVIVFSAIAIGSMVAGNLLALLQNNVKRILAYSSIAHLGYLLVAFLAGGVLGATAVSFYLVAYFVTTLGAFGVVTVLSTGEREAGALDDYRGLAFRRPWLAGSFAAMLLSLAGIPLTAGFIGKFLLVTAGVGVAWWLLVVVLVLASGVGIFYYLRVVSAMFQPAPEVAGVPLGRPGPAPAGTLVLAILTFLLIGLGVYPVPLLQLIQSTIGGLG
jgi:NADH-quinone oxidoreductase subunit N